MSTLDALIEDFRAPNWTVVSRVIMGLLAVLLLWSLFAKLDEVAFAPGDVVPQGQVKTIQHLEGGIIVNIMVTEGQSVREGSELIQLDLATSAVNAEELQVRLDGLLLSQARLMAEANDMDLAFPSEVAERRPRIVATETASYRARKEELEITRSVLEGQVTQRERDVSELRARMTATAENLALASRQLEMADDLMRDQLIAPLEHLNRQREVADLRGQLAQLNEAVPRAESALSEAHERVEELLLRFRREAREQLGELEVEIARTTELMATADDQQVRTIIRSPVGGIVKNMRYHTIGGVVRPGEPILDIVPTDEKLVIEARLDPIDRGYVEAGQRAVVKINTYDFVRYGGLEGEVIAVAPDSTTPENAPPYFKVVVQTEKDYLGDEPGDLPIMPGMGAIVDIHTGNKSVFDYFIKPVLKLKHEGFRER